MTDRAPRVSVILPTYNRATYVGEAVSSVLEQGWTDLELIVVDDGSTDGTRGVLSRFADPRLRCIFQENAGRSRARNVALREARGEYIAFIDSDDVWLPGKLERQVRLLDARPELGMVYTAAACIDAEGRSLNHTYRAPVSGRIYPHIAFFRPVTVTLPTVLLRRTVLDEVGPFDEVMERFEDTDLWRRVAKRHLVGALDEVTCLVRTHADNELRAQDPARIAAAIDYYVAKVLREDAGEVEADVLQAGARRLYCHYGAAMLGLPEFAAMGRVLIEKGRRHFAPKVSIVIPVYNGADYLAEAINSALRQTYWNTEVVVVNDGSTDSGATERIALGYGPRLRYVSKPNGGVASALNAGIREMTGDYFSWLSHDDLYVPEKIELQVEALAEQPEPGSCVLYGDYSVFTESPGEGRRVPLPGTPPEDFRFFLTTQNVLNGCTLLVPRGAFARHGGFNERLRTTQDYDLWFRMAETERFVHRPALLVHAHAHAGQGTHALKDVVLDECNELLAGFVARLTAEEIARGTGMPAPAGYFEMAANLHRRGFRRAAQRALELGRDAVLQALGSPDAAAEGRPAREIGELAWRLASMRLGLEDEIRAKTEAWGASERQVHALSQELAALRQVQAELQAERDGLRRRLEEVYDSSSWRLTMPLRRIAGLLSLRRVAGLLTRG